MVQWSDPPQQSAHRPEFDRTVIRPSGVGGPVRGPGAEDPPDLVDTRLARPAAEVKSSWRLYLALALGCLALGGAVGTVAVLVSSGMISFTDPSQEQAGQQLAVQRDEPAVVPSPGIAEQLADGPAIPDVPVAEPPAGDDLDVPADPYFDMSLSAVIPLAGDPVLLKGGLAQRGAGLSERSVPATVNLNGANTIPTSMAYVLDSQMLDEDGNLVIRAPGTEADFQFGNFGGGDETEAIIVDENRVDSGSAEPDLPVFLRPQTQTLDLFLNERPIGQGPNRIEIRTVIEDPISLKDFLEENGFDDDAAAPLIEYAAKTYQLSTLSAGDKIALRGVRLPNKLGRIGDFYRPVQMSVYSDDGYLGTAAYSSARGGPAYVAGADPWFGKPIVSKKVDGDKAAASPASHRLIDGLYATAVRNAVPASIVGEAIAYLAPMTDLKRAARPDERFTLIFSDAPRDTKRGGGKVLFAGIRRGDTWSARCYVLKAPGNRGYACVNEGGRVSLSGAMLVPVRGVLTSKFGPRFHPIKKVERLHAGVDWAAPTGTPIRAAFSGKVTYRDVRGGYGNFVELTHKGGISSRYAHMHDYGDGIELGSVVEAGDVIGYVGTTGLSTGPHLHFEIRKQGVPTDPLSFKMAAGTDSAQTIGNDDLKIYQSVIAEILTGQ